MSGYILVLMYTQGTEFLVNCTYCFNFCSSRHCILLRNGLPPAWRFRGLVMMLCYWYARTYRALHTVLSLFPQGELLWCHTHGTMEHSRSLSNRLACEYSCSSSAYISCYMSVWRNVGVQLQDVKVHWTLPQLCNIDFRNLPYHLCDLCHLIVQVRFELYHIC